MTLVAVGRGSGDDDVGFAVDVRPHLMGNAGGSQEMLDTVAVE